MISKNRSVQWVWWGWFNWVFFFRRLDSTDTMGSIYSWLLRVGPVELRKWAPQKQRGIRIQIDSGVMITDPADEHRWMLVTYTAATDSVRVFRRCDEIDAVKAAQKTGWTAIEDDAENM